MKSNHGHGQPPAQPMTFADLGVLFNDATNQLLGGIDKANRAQVLSDLHQVQTGLAQLLKADPDDFQGVAGIHAQNIVDQINLEISAIKSVGKDPFAAKYINDVQRDLIDIVQGDDVLADMAKTGGKNGFAAVPDLLAPPAPFQGNAEQTAFMKQFAADAVTLGEKAVALADAHAAPGSAEVMQEITDIKAFGANASAFSLAQGGLYSARFNNEFASDGVNGTASRALIQGLETGNADQIKAAAEVLAANAQDVANNMLGIGDTPVVPNNGIPDQIGSLAVAGAVFNDATTKLIGGISPSNQDSVIQDLQAVQTAIKSLLQNEPEQFGGAAGLHAEVVANQLGLEIQAVQNAGTGKFSAAAISDIHNDIIHAIQADPALAALANDDGAMGFAALPDALKAAGPLAINGQQAKFLSQYQADVADIGQKAIAALNSGDQAAIDGVIAKVTQFTGNADTFVTKQGAAYQAQFLDELSQNGVNGTAAKALIAGLQAKDADQVQNAEDLLTANATALAQDQAAKGGGKGNGDHGPQIGHDSPAPSIDHHDNHHTHAMHDGIMA